MHQLDVFLCFLLLSYFFLSLFWGRKEGDEEEGHHREGEIEVVPHGKPQASDFHVRVRLWQGSAPCCQAGWGSTNSAPTPQPDQGDWCLLNCKVISQPGDVIYAEQFLPENLLSAGENLLLVTQSQQKGLHHPASANIAALTITAWWLLKNGLEGKKKMEKNLT